MTVREMSIGRWHLALNATVTLDAHLTAPDWTDCDCTHCLNLRTLDRRAFGSTLLAVFLQAGIDYRKPRNIYHSHKLKNGRHLYGGWYHFVGSILEGDDCWTQTDAEGKSFVQKLDSISEHAAIGVTNRIALPADSFSGHPLVQLEVGLELPWVINAWEPT